ncbi:DNA primase catalytic subunit PriS [Halobacteriales archaeon SW_6_65_15]|nr:MAG: DNA primase catalytic subunit PriS [Halobacteriales archaeon SW_6_65_15]
MEERTRAYLRGRFRDHYRRKTWSSEPSGEARGRRTELTPPPDHEAREWGYIPWTAGPTTMVRHQSLLELGELGDFLRRERPRHVYFSAGRYDDPGADDMDAKGWRDSDLVFDIDADHLSGVDPQRDSYAEMLAAGKDEVRNLLDLLEGDFGFEELTVVFSGGRGYHVHVRDEGVRELDRDERREIVDYIRGEGIDRDAIQRTEMGGTATRRVLETEGGWGQRVHRELLALADQLLELPEDDALDRLKEFDGIGDGRAKTILGAVSEDYEKLESGNIERGGQGIRELTKVMTQKVVAEESAAIDEPVTTDLRRLIRLPGSLHGGTGLEVTRIPRDEIDAFDPLSDPVPETFEGHDVTVEVNEPGPVELRDESFTLPDGDVSVPEYVAVFLMARGRAEKGKE